MFYVLVWSVLPATTLTTAVSKILGNLSTLGESWMQSQASFLDSVLDLAQPNAPAHQAQANGLP